MTDHTPPAGVSRRALEPAFRAASYTLEGPPEVRLQVGQTSVALDAWLTARGGAEATLLTACNPWGQAEQTADANRRAQQELQAWLVELGRETWPARSWGAGWPAEPMIAAIGLTAAEADAACERFDQAAVLRLRRGRAPWLRWHPALR